METRLGVTQLKVLRYIWQYQQQHGESPTVREICDALGLNTPSLGHHHLRGLERKKYIRRRENIARSIEIIRWEWLEAQDRAPKMARMLWLPVKGEIAAGLPIVAYDDTDELHAVALSIAGSTDAYILRVRGNSMIDEHICNGDLVVIRPQDTARNGENVVALLADNSATLKTFYHEGSHIRLQPANPTMAPIIVPADEEILIRGVVRAVMRLAA
jgi:repressor LexA